MPVVVFYQILLFLGDSILLGIFKLGDQLLYMYGVEEKVYKQILDGDFILDDGHE